MTALLFAVSNAFSQVPSYVPTNGLVGWWPFNENANDESGNGNNGVVNGATLTSDRNGSVDKAYSFNGSNNYITTPLTTISGNSYTISTWFYNTIAQVNEIGLVVSRTTWNVSTGLYLFNNTQYLQSTSTCNSFHYNGYNVNNLNDSVWHLYNATFDGNIFKIYKDGILVSSTISNIQMCINAPFIFGNDNLVPNRMFNGKIDDIGIWNRALTPQEITALYTTQVPCILTNNFFATDTISACGNSVSLNAQNTGSNYLWSNNATTQSITANTTGWYKCTVSQGTICSVSDSVYVSLANALPTSLQAGLVGYWPFCGNANDERGNGNNGTVNGATLTSDRNGVSNSAYNFDGINDFIIAPGNSQFSNNSKTIAFWVNFNTSSGGEEIICLGSQSSTTWGCIVDNGLMVLNYGRGCTNNPSQPAPINLTMANWHQLIFVSTGVAGNTSMYFDGQFIGSGSTAISVGSCSNSNLYFGVDIFSSPEHFDGKLDDICIWNRALTTSEVQQLYSAQSSNTTSNSNSGNSNSASSINNLPKGISYQAVARDSAGTPLSNANVEVRFTLRDSSITGTVVYKEVHTLTTNQFGLFTTAIGSGTAQTGDYNTINWMGSAKYLDVEIKQGANFLLMGSQQLLAVPYANAAISAGKIKNAQVPVFADNSAAIAGGLQVGDMYRTPSGALMIVY